MERFTTRNSNGSVGIDCPLKPYNYEDIKGVLERLANIEDIIGDTYDLDRLRELVEADKDGRCVVLPCKTVFEPTWDAGPDCDGNCPHCFEPERCDICAKGKLFIYERPCRQKHIPLLGKTVFATREAAEAALAKEGQNNADQKLYDENRRL